LNPQPNFPNVSPPNYAPQPPAKKPISAGLTIIVIVAIVFGSCIICTLIGGITELLKPKTETAVVNTANINASTPPTIINSSANQSATAKPTDRNKPTPSPTKEVRTMTRNLATIEGVENNTEKVARIDSLLTQLDAKYPENSEQIGDMTAGAYGEITKKGHSASIIGIMEAMIEVAGSKSKITYADAITAYAMLRVNGMN